MTSWWFALDSSLLNGYLVYAAAKFYRDTNEQTAKKLFLFSVIHLPVLLILLMIHKKRCTQGDSSSPPEPAGTLPAQESAASPSSTSV